MKNEVEVKTAIRRLQAELRGLTFGRERWALQTQISALKWVLELQYYWGEEYPLMMTHKGVLKED